MASATAASGDRQTFPVQIVRIFSNWAPVDRLSRKGSYEPSKRIESDGGRLVTIGGPESADARTTQPPEPPIASGRKQARSLGLSKHYKYEGRLAAVIAMGGTGILLASVVRIIAPSSSYLLLAILWSCMCLAVGLLIRDWRSSGVFEVRGSDLLIGLAGGLSLRFVQGLLSNANGFPFPSDQLLVEGHYMEWIISNVLVLGLIGPSFEEFYFRGALFLTLIAVLSRMMSRLWANSISVVVSTGAFVVVHYAYASQLTTQGVSLTLVGFLACGIVLLTRRMWGAVAMHATYNLSFFALVTLGSVGAGT